MTNLSFFELEDCFKKSDFPSIENDVRGIRFLKLRAISRKSIMEEFCSINGINLRGLPVKEYFHHLFESDNVLEKSIDKFINHKYKEERQVRSNNESYLLDQLNRLQNFDWGGSFGNSLDKNIVNNYVKKIQSFAKINEEIEGNLLSSLKGYTLSSWYNHWTSMIIEDIFKDHEKVLPTIGLIKKVDFFINNVPFDLKVTYFPDQLLTEKLKEAGFGNELTRLKQICRRLDIFIPEDLRDKALKFHLYNKVKDDHRSAAREFITELNQRKKEIIADTEESSYLLKKWFFENQGERRFDASNRFFLVLVDEKELMDSWKLKRNFNFLKENIRTHLDNLAMDMSGLDVEFKWKGEAYRCKSDVLFLKYNSSE